MTEPSASRRWSLALVVYIKELPLPVPDREDIIADISRLAYDYAMLTT